mgnify:FL=1
MTIWTEARLREVVEREWGPVRFLVAGRDLLTPGAFRLVVQGETRSPIGERITGGRYVEMGGCEETQTAYEMLAAAALAPDLWALVEAVRLWRETSRILSDIGESGSAEEYDKTRTVLWGREEAVLLALAAVLGEEERRRASEQREG